MTKALLYWEDFPVGETVVLGSRTVSADAIKDFARQFDPQPMHLDEEAAKASVLGALSASGWHSCALMMRILCDGFLLRSASMGAPGLEEIRWIRPVHADDTIILTRETLDRRASKSNPSMGLTQFALELVNQRDEPVLQGRYWQLFARRPREI